MAMIYTVATQFKEDIIEVLQNRLDDEIKEVRKLQEAEEQRQKEKVEEELKKLKNKKYLTFEQFEAWKIKYNEEMKRNAEEAALASSSSRKSSQLKKLAADKSAASAGVERKLTGRQVFEMGLYGANTQEFEEYQKEEEEGEIDDFKNNCADDDEIDSAENRLSETQI